MIEIKHLSKTFQMKDGAVNALKDINLTIRMVPFMASSACPVRANPRWCAASTCWNAPPRQRCDRRHRYGDFKRSPAA